MSGLASTFIAHRLVYRATTTLTPVLGTTQQPEVAGPTTTQSEIVVVLGPDWQSTREGSQETIVDAAAQRVHAINRDAGTVVSQSLYANVAFRQAEASNRLMILQVLEAGGGSAGTRADVEACLGVETDGPSPPQFRRKLLRRNEWVHGRTKVATVEDSDHALPVQLLRRWLAHEVMLHPKVAEAIAASGRAPKLLHHRLRLLPEVYERTLTLVSSEEIEIEREAALRGLAPAPPHDEDHARVRELLARPIEGLPNRMANGHVALEAGRYLEAFLWFMAHVWADASADPSGMAALNEVLTEQEFAYGFRLAVMAAGQGEQLEKILKFYDIAEARAGELGHVIGVIRANALTQIASRERDPAPRDELRARARSELLRAIEADPGLVGVYKDLGDLYLEGYAMGLVWELWDFGRSLVPGHFLFESVVEYERDLRTRSPQFF